MMNSQKTILCEYMDKYNSDKASKHNYTIFYDKFLSGKRVQVNNVFELGLGWHPDAGASHRAWKEYFTQANIYGADIDKNVLFQESRIKTFFCDQTNVEDIKALWKNKEISDVEMDLMIDDGLHEYEANIIFFESSFFKVKKGGYYIVEDINNNELYLFEKYFSDNKYNHFFVKEKSIYKPVDNNLLVVSKF